MWPGRGRLIVPTPPAGDLSKRIASTEFVQENSLPSVSVRAFGAVVDGVTNDTTAIQKTINFVGAAGGGNVIIPGHCAVNATLTITLQGVYLVGIGAKSSGLSINSVMSTDIVQFSGTFLGGGVKNLGFDFFATPTGGAAINIGNGLAVGRITVSDVSMTGPFIGINVNQSTGGQTRISNVDFASTVNDGVHISGTNSTVIDNISTFQSPVGGGAGIHIVNGGGIFMANSFIDGNSNGILINPGTGQTVIDVWGSNLDLDTSTTTGLTIDTSAGTGLARNMTFSNVRTGFANNGSNTAGRGIFIAGTGSTDITFTGGEDARNIQEGIYIHGGSDIRVVNRLVLGNSVQGANVWHGINVDGGDKISIIGGQSGPYNDGGGNNQNFGIAVENTFSGQITIIGVDTRGNGNTAGIANNGTGALNQILSCPPYNPIGVTASANMGASPFTYTAGASPETHYVRQNGTNTATITKGGQQIATLAGATTYYTIELGPNESYVTTWATTTPTFTKDVH